MEQGASSPLFRRVAGRSGALGCSDLGRHFGREVVDLLLDAFAHDVQREALDFGLHALQVLLDQVFVKAADGKQTVAQYLKGANTTPKGFTLYVVGEGIEKKVDDFAAEVAAQVAAAKGA